MHRRRRRPRRRLQAPSLAPLRPSLRPSSASPAGTPPKLLSVAAAATTARLTASCLRRRSPAPRPARGTGSARNCKRHPYPRSLIAFEKHLQSAKITVHWGKTCGLPSAWQQRKTSGGAPASASSSSSACARSRMCARERSDDDVWGERATRDTAAVCADGATATGSADRRSEERGERESDLQQQRSPCLPPSSRESAARVRLALSSLPSPESVWPRGRRREEARASPRRPPPPRSTGSFELTTDDCTQFLRGAPSDFLHDFDHFNNVGLTDIKTPLLLRSRGVTGRSSSAPVSGR